jgi:hypothetical protein
MQTIKEDVVPIVQNLKAKPIDKVSRGRSLSALKNDKIINGKLMRPLEGKLQAKSTKRADEEKKKRSLSKKSNKGEYKRLSQMSHMSTRSKKILEKMKQREIQQATFP